MFPAGGGWRLRSLACLAVTFPSRALCHPSTEGCRGVPNRWVLPCHGQSTASRLIPALSCALSEPHFPSLIVHARNELASAGSGKNRSCATPLL